jgi:diguanylate cyclase (GGDEF)-like protein
MSLNPAARLSFGLVMFTMSVLLFADMFGVLPKKELIELEARKKVCESLAVQLSAYASKSDTLAMSQLLKNFVTRNEDINAAAMLHESGAVLANAGKFSDEYRPNDTHRSTAELVVVPVYSGADKWGAVNVEFGSGHSGGMFGALQNSLFGLLIFTALFSYLGYFLILRRTLRILDPKAVIPDRVRAAFNTLSEGVLIVDKKDQILLANDAFAKKVNKDQDALLGMEASSLNWNRRKSEALEELPWLKSIQSGLNQVGVSLNLSTPANGVRALSVNSAPILDDVGNARGALVTFDDVTEVHETNLQLEKAVDNLVRNQTEIKRKNDELETLAARDSLTGCYNRRALFDKFENIFDSIKRIDGKMACIMVDIDHFKSVNDRFGHSVGDEVIRIVADVLNGCQRDDALIGRYGGEEFCVILPGVDIDGALTVAERLRSNVRLGSEKYMAEQLTVTASFGVSEYEAGLQGCSQLIDRADRALYAAKNAGRNRVMKWIPELDKITSIVFETPVAENLGNVTGNKYKDLVRTELLHKKISQLEDELRQSQDEKARRDFTDSVTGLPTRVILEDRLRQAIALSERSDSMAVVAILNVDMFSRINLALGEKQGNEFLKEVGSRLKEITRRSDTVASMVMPGHAGPSLSRLREDEFALVFSGIKDIESISYIVRRIQEKFKGNISVDGKSFYVTTTVGVSLYPSDGDDALELIDNARSAQKHAKESSNRNNIEFYSREISGKVLSQMRLEVELLNALERNQFRLVYQPKMNMKTGKVDSVETLVRWMHPEKGMLSPFAFIPLAEKSGIIGDLGQWILKSACIQTKAWLDMGIKNIRTSVNVSAVEFSNSNYVQNVKDVLSEVGLNPQHIEIEITETAVLEDFNVAAKTINELQYLGVTVTLDDFGTGYSSFSYLGKLDFDWIKLDRTFLLEALSSERSCTMYESIIQMAHNIGLKVVSEGIEDNAQYEFVSGLKVDELQGYILSKPVDADEITIFCETENGQQSCCLEVVRGGSGSGICLQ